MPANAKLLMVWARMPAPCARVVADHADAVHAQFHARHHTQIARLALDRLRARIEQVGQQVAEVAVRVVHVHLGRAAVEGAGDGGIGLVGHPATRALVLGVACARLLRVTDAGHAFDIDGDEDFHGLEK